MKKLNYALIFAIITVASFIYVSCTETGSVLDTEIIAASTLSDDTDSPDNLADRSIDSIASATDTEKEDSLNPRKYIYLTIDDAPLNGCKYIDSIISAEKVKAGIFLVGNPIDGSHRFRKYHQQLKENPYIEIYNHSYSHANNKYSAFYKQPELVLNDFEKNQADFNILHKIARLPGRNIWQVDERKKNYKQASASSAALLAENGYKIFGWDVEWTYDSKNYSPLQTIDELVDKIEGLCKRPSATFTPNHVVLLMHDQMFGKTNEANDLGQLIRKLKDCGYTFECLTAYP